MFTSRSSWHWSQQAHDQTEFSGKCIVKILNPSKKPTATACSLDAFRDEIRIVALTCLAMLLTVFLPTWISVGHSQDTNTNQTQQEPVQQDPATPTPVITETLRTIREVENLNRYIEQNDSLAKENKELKNEVASLATQVKKLTQEIATQNERLRKQLLTLPEVKIQSKVIGQGTAQAILDIGGRSIRIRNQVKMSIPVENGVWTLIQVEKITKDVVEIRFLELDRLVTIYD